MKPKQPQWILSKDWAISTNALNWILLKASHNVKSGEFTGYKPVGYYPSAEMLLTDLHRKICLSEPENTDLIAHINHALLAATAAISTFSGLIDALAPIPDKAGLSIACNRCEAA